MEFKPIDLSIFPKEREQKLREIYRYRAFEIMKYRANLWTHTHRLLWLLEELLPLAEKLLPGFDVEKARILALVHDDAEMVTGDMPAHIKSNLTGEELAAYNQSEALAIEQLVARYPKKVHGYVYGDLLKHAKEWDCIESQLVSYVDKLEALSECNHDVLAGNIMMLEGVSYYYRGLVVYTQKFPALSPLVGTKQSPLTYFPSAKSHTIKDYEYLGKPPTRESITIDTPFPFYNIWRRVTIEKGGEEGVGWLINESPKMIMKIQP